MLTTLVLSPRLHREIGRRFHPRIQTLDRQDAERSTRTERDGTRNRGPRALARVVEDGLSLTNDFRRTRG